MNLIRSAYALWKALFTGAWEPEAIFLFGVAKAVSFAAGIVVGALVF